MEKKLIGYKLIKPKYKAAVANICDVISFDFDRFSKDLSKFDLGLKSLKDAEVLDLWFEPVYEEVPKFKVGDWVTIIPGTKSNFHKGKNTFKIGFVYEETFICENSFDDGNGVFFGRFRLATPEEIKAAQIPNITINGYKAKFISNPKKVQFGCQELDLDFITKLDYLVNSQKIDISSYSKEIKQIKDELSK
jgi:hypothetical protein